MKSPFPGMDPYLEEHWEDVHARLVGYVADALQPQLPDDLIPRIEQRVLVESEGETQARKPDIRVVEDTSRWRAATGATSTAVLDEPIRLEPIPNISRQRSVLIFDASGNRLITAIEVLSPWNKRPGKVMKAYMSKRQEYVAGGVNLVEIDLVRRGDWTDMLGDFGIPEDAITPYRVTVTAVDEDRPYHYPIPLQSRLPTIRIPLRPTDQAAKINLQELVEKAYAMGRYDHIDYTKSCSPPLQGEDATWAEQTIAAARQQS